VVKEIWAKSKSIKDWDFFILYKRLGFYLIVIDSIWIVSANGLDALSVLFHSEVAMVTWCLKKANKALIVIKPIQIYFNSKELFDYPVTNKQFLFHLVLQQQNMTLDNTEASLKDMK
jgi:hypothetical protein